MSPRRLASTLVLLALVPVLAACDSKAQEGSLFKGETEGIYVDVAKMKYQVQISRELNPAISEDRTLLTGVAAKDSTVAADETWFAVFIRIENEQDSPQKPAISYAIEDTEGNHYAPITLARDNPFHYVLSDVPPKSVVPEPNSVAAQTSIGGLELLFKLKRTSLDDRPLVLKIHSPSNYSDVSEVDLDV